MTRRIPLMTPEERAERARIIRRNVYRRKLGRPLLEMPALAKPTPIQRFVRFVDRPSDTCWRWLGSLNRLGYGQFNPDAGPDRKPVLAHRYAYELWVGPIPEGLTIDHLCQTRSCVNPAHLEAVPFLENHRRAMPGTGPCRRGHDPSNYRYRPNGKRHSCRECAKTIANMAP